MAINSTSASGSNPCAAATRPSSGRARSATTSSWSRSNPRLAQLSHARINDMVHAAGVEKLNEGTRDELARYNFFAAELFGIEEPIARIVEYFKSAAQRLEVRKRILLLMGPVGGGKSTIVTMLKRGLEDWTRADEGAVYAIKDCPMHEEPLHLIPHELRAEIEKHYGIYIEGDLCPQCRYALEHTYGGRHEDVKVHRIALLREAARRHRHLHARPTRSRRTSPS